MILLSASKVWLWVQRDGGLWSFLTWTKNHFVLHQHPEVSLEVVVVETLVILLENLFYLLLELGDPVSRWMLSVPDLLQRFLIRPSATGKYECSHFLWEISPLLHRVFFWVDFRCVHRLQLLKVCDQLRHPSKFHPRTKRIRGTISSKSFFPNWWILGLVFRRNRVILNQWTKRNDRSFKWLLQNVFHRASSHQIIDLVNVSQIGVTFHWICPPIFIQTWLQQYGRACLLSLCALLFQQSHFVSDLCGVDVQWFQERSSQELAKF